MAQKVVEQVGSPQHHPFLFSPQQPLTFQPTHSHTHILQSHTGLCITSLQSFLYLHLSPSLPTKEKKVHSPFVMPKRSLPRRASANERSRKTQVAVDLNWDDNIESSDDDDDNESRRRRQESSSDSEEELTVEQQRKK